MIKFLKRYFHPSVEKSLSTFESKIDELQERINIDKNSIEFHRQVINQLSNQIIDIDAGIAKAENAIEALELITGEREKSTTQD